MLAGKGSKPILIIWGNPILEPSHVGRSMRTNPLRAPFVVLHWSRSSWFYPVVAVIGGHCTPALLEGSVPRGNMREITKNLGAAKVSDFSAYL